MASSLQIKGVTLLQSKCTVKDRIYMLGSWHLHDFGKQYDITVEETSNNRCGSFAHRVSWNAAELCHVTNPVTVTQKNLQVLVTFEKICHANRLSKAVDIEPGI